MEVARSYKTLLLSYQTTRCRILEDCNLKGHVHYQKLFESEIWGPRWDGYGY
jgi:hypothetical protein